MHYGFYDGAEVCDSQYMDDTVRSNSKAVMVRRSVLAVRDPKILTCSYWEDAEAFARQLVELLRE